ncbi:MAG: hypothetical protein M3065_08105, partial [Actinomycetota bacterium]|nr:hypothetical protein [Actinomycetota bacterium]
MSPKVALARMQAAGMKVGAASSSVDEETALRALNNGTTQTPDAPAPNGGQVAAAAQPNGGAKATANDKAAPQARPTGDGAKRASAPPAATGPAASASAPATPTPADGTRAPQA